ncbi:dihydropteroate synthase [Halogeometricum limi]|uniref:Probable bifunctional folylpolyglutamate synthase/dihydropteroate synthase n=1 Tax=Halogeometricum limi TaxID=555875 RepID=A0A1I6IFN5_9EURY|nr:dihydropteroate synthase [Halogeometricum limi]SFR65464.1 dihydropteroate synthase [Halogeometricum limi]
MHYHEAADRLNGLQRRRPKLGTETTARMLSHLGDPQESADCVQIAGSNGKGSTARMLDSVLRTAGLDVGLFTSPKLNDFREQIRVNGRKIPKEAVASSFEELVPCLETLRSEDDMPTHFEVITALALHHFGTEDVDVAILEVGIGGRYDATSAVDPVASAVTSVSLEHTELLGDTVEEIARDKAQVAPANAPLVTGTDGAALEAIRGVSDVVTVGPAGGDADVVAAENGMRSPVESEVSITGPDWSLETALSLLGQHQATNAGVAATLARQMASVDETTLADGLRKTTWPGRFEIVERDPTVVLDGSHNPGAAATLRDLLGRYEYDDLHVVFAAMADKEYEEMIAEFPAVRTAYTASPKLDRAEDAATLADAFEGHATDVRAVPSVQEAVERAVDTAADDDFVLVTGSLYAVAEARDRWIRQVVPKDGPRGATADAFDDRTFADADPETVETRVFETLLRGEQAEVVTDEFERLGGRCVTSREGTPEKLVRTVLSGSVADVRSLVGRLRESGLGLAHVARQLETALDGPPAGPFEGAHPAVMGILNVTPDSFHDGGEYDRLDAAVEHAEAMVDAGADVLDIGGESTRPGADPVSAETERNRVVPVIEALSSLDVPISIDTRKATVADAALDAGADVVNDVSGLSDPEMRFVVADHDASLVLMHSLSAPVDPSETATYDDVVEDVRTELAERVLLAERAGIDRERMLVDPGCGFGKSAAESFELVDRLHEFHALSCPVMLGHSHKSMFEDVAPESGARLVPTLAATAMAAERSADVVRVHDVAENAAVVRTVDAANGSD